MTHKGRLAEIEKLGSLTVHAEDIKYLLTRVRVLTGALEQIIGPVSIEDIGGYHLVATKYRSVARKALAEGKK